MHRFGGLRFPELVHSAPLLLLAVVRAMDDVGAAGAEKVGFSSWFRRMAARFFCFGEVRAEVPLAHFCDESWGLVCCGSPACVHAGLSDAALPIGWGRRG